MLTSAASPVNLVFILGSQDRERYSEREVRDGVVHGMTVHSRKSFMLPSDAGLRVS